MTSDITIQFCIGKPGRQISDLFEFKGRYARKKEDSRKRSPLQLHGDPGLGRGTGTISE